MNYLLSFHDAKNKWTVVTDTKDGLIGHYYTFKTMKAHIVKTAYDEADIHYRCKTKEPIPVGTEVKINTWWMNFYGSYFRINWKGQEYDVNTDNVLIDMKD